MTPRRLLAFVLAFAAATAVPLSAAAEIVRVPTAAAAKFWAAQAAADGIRVQVVVNDFLVVSNIVDAGGPSAQAVVNAFGDSHGYAAYPYPGDIVLTAHGLSQGAAPKYPLIAESDPTQPKSDVSNGPYELHSQSSDDASAAVAQASAGGSGVAAGTTQSSASSAYDAATGAVSAAAETTVEGVSIKGVLSIGRVHSLAQMTAVPGSAVKRTSDTEVADVAVGGQQVGLTDKGLVLAGTDVPLPPDSTANALLSSAGITVHYLAPSRTDAATVAPGFSVGVQQNVPGVGDTTVNYIFGQASATAQATGPPALTATSAPAVPGTTPEGGATAAPTATRPSSTTLGSGSIPATGSSGPTSTAQPPVTAGTPSTHNGYALASATGPSSASFYLVIAAGAIVMVAAAQLFRILAVRLTWT